jgi:hypothetical protein
MLGANSLLSRDLARSICAYGMHGKIAIVSEKPTELLSVTRKQWLKLIRRLRRERSSTLNASRIAELEWQIDWMQRLSFTSRTPTDPLEADVNFATADDFVRVPPVCSTLYVTYDFEREKLHLLATWMPKRGVVVAYEQG